MLCLLYLLDADIFPPWLWTPWDDDEQRFHFARSMLGCCWLLHIVIVSICAYALLQVKQNPYKSYNRIPFKSQFTPHPTPKEKQNLHTSPVSPFYLGHSVRSALFEVMPSRMTLISAIIADLRPRSTKLTGSQAIDDEAKACWNGGVLEIAAGSGWENHFLGEKKLSFWEVDAFLGWQLLFCVRRIPLRSLQAAVRTALHFLATDAFLGFCVSMKNFLCQSCQSTSGVGWCCDIKVHPFVFFLFSYSWWPKNKTQ